jgi:hypothetical protein
MFNVGSKQISQKTCKHTVWNLVSKSYQGPIKKYNDNITLISAIFSSVHEASREKGKSTWLLLAIQECVLSQVYLMDQGKSLIVYRDMVNRNCV